MIELTFVKNHAIRKVFIKNKTVTLITPEFNYQPVIFDEEKYNALKNSENMASLTKLTYEELEKNQDKRVVELVTELKEAKVDFNNEQELKEDIIKDFQDSKWRCIKR